MTCDWRRFLKIYITKQHTHKLSEARVTKKYMHTEGCAQFLFIKGGVIEIGRCIP